MHASSQHPEPLATHGQIATPAEISDLQVPPEEWRAIVAMRPSVLVEGPESSAEKLIRAVTTTLQGAAYDWDCLPADPGLGAIVIVRRIDLLSTDEHQRLLDFLSANTQTRAQVITTTTRPLYPLVESGRFPADLYYRLNTIRLELGESS